MGKSDPIWSWIERTVFIVAIPAAICSVLLYTESSTLPPKVVSVITDMLSPSLMRLIIILAILFSVYVSMLRIMRVRRTVELSWRKGYLPVTTGATAPSVLVAPGLLNTVAPQLTEPVGENVAALKHGLQSRHRVARGQRMFPVWPRE